MRALAGPVRRRGQGWGALLRGFAGAAADPGALRDGPLSSEQDTATFGTIWNKLLACIQSLS